MNAMAQTWQLMASGGAMDQLVRKPHVASRIIEHKVDPESGKWPKPTPARWREYSEYFVSHDIGFIASPDKNELVMTGAVAKPAAPEMENLLDHLPLVSDVQKHVLRQFLGWKSLGIPLPRVFQKVYDFNINHDLPKITEDKKEEHRTLTKPVLLQLQTSQSYRIPHSTHFLHFFVRRKDLQPFYLFQFKMGGNIFSQVTGIWLLTRPEADFIPLPFTTISQYWMDGKIECSHAIPLYYSLIDEPRPEDNIPTHRWITQIQPPKGLRYPDTQLLVDPHHLIFRLLLVLCYDGKPVRRKPQAKFHHPISQLNVSLNTSPDMTGDGYYFETVMPTMYGGVQNPAYVLYQIIYHPPPTHYGDDVIGKHLSYYSTVNGSRLDDVFHLEVVWNDEVVRENFSKPENLYFEVYPESFNVTISQDGMTALRFIN